MKKLIFTLFTVTCVLTANAQNVFPLKVNKEHDEHKDHNHKGVFFIGGALSYWNNTDEKTVSFDFCPEIGYLFNKDFGVGLLLGYEYETEFATNIKQVNTSYKVAPFARYYYLHKEPFNLYLDAGFGFNFGKNKTGTLSNTTNGYEIGIRPGACVDLTEGLCLCLRMGFVGYRNNFFMGEEPGIGTKGFGVRFAPEELMIGLELEF